MVEDASRRPSWSLFALPRALVSQNRRRYQDGAYDLDLCYLHPRIIVMGFPAAGLEAMYRNPRTKVRAFLHHHHGEDFKVYNFCAETKRRYSASVFDGRVEYFPIEDHNVPTLEQVTRFGDDAANWLAANPARVVVLHCKAGKGRAGMMACTLLLRMGYVAGASEAIRRYNHERVCDGRGLTVPSQRKWVRYAEQLLSQRLVLAPHAPLPLCGPPLVIEELNLQNALTGVRPPLLRLRIAILDPETAQKVVVHETTGHERFLVHARVQGSVVLEFRRINCRKVFDKKYFRVWFHTLFTSAERNPGKMIFSRDAMDWVARDRKFRRLPAAFQLEATLRDGSISCISRDSDHHHH